MARPAKGSYFSHYEGYMSLVEENDLQQAFASRENLIDNFFNSIDESRTTRGYAPGKWTLKELLQHLIDCEWIFAYRALCVARGELNSLPGFDEDAYATNSEANSRSWTSLCDEFDQLRKSTKRLFDSFSPLQLNRLGIANNYPITPLALGYITLGHAYHHIRIVQERYLPVI